MALRESEQPTDAERSRRVWLFVIGTVIIGALAGMGIYHGRKLERERRAERQQKQRINDAISSAAKPYNADTSWWEKEMIYTIQAQDALIRTDRRPVLILGRINDISKDNSDGYRLSIRWNHVEFVMNANSASCKVPSFPNTIDPYEAYGDDYYAVVANVSSVRKTDERSEEDSRFLAEAECMYLTRIPGLPEERTLDGVLAPHSGS